MNYLSFSLWGDKPIYNVGIIRNAELWKIIYPDWKMVVYYNNTVPIDTVNKLTKMSWFNFRIVFYPKFFQVTKINAKVICKKVFTSNSETGNS